MPHNTFPPLIKAGDFVRLDDPYTPGLPNPGDDSVTCTHGLVTSVLEHISPQECQNPAFARTIANEDGRIPRRVELVLVASPTHPDSEIGSKNTDYIDGDDPVGQIPLIPQVASDELVDCTVRPKMADYNVDTLTLIERGGGSYMTVDAHLGTILEDGYDAPYFASEE